MKDGENRAGCDGEVDPEAERNLLRTMNLITIFWVLCGEEGIWIGERADAERSDLRVASVFAHAPAA